MLIPIEREKALNKIQNIVLIKLTITLGVEGMYFNVRKVIAFLQDQEQVKGAHSHHSFPKQYWKF